MIFLNRQKPISCIIMGSGRSGTSMLAEALVKNYEFLGNNPIGMQNTSTPHGRFEDADINYINDRIIEKNGSKLPLGPDNEHKEKYAGWLTVINDPYMEHPPILSAFVDQIANLCSHKTFCFKDPRFSLTFPTWDSVITETLKQEVKYVVIFRHPSKSAQSTVKEPAAMKLNLTFESALEVWQSMYKHILATYCRDRTFFIHYDQVINKQRFRDLERFLHAALDKVA